MSEILPAVKTAVAEITAVVDERHTKYGSSNIANSPGGPLNGLRVRLHDKLARLNNYVDTGGAADFDDDNLRDCFIDICGYALIGLLVLDGRWPGLEKPGGSEQLVAEYTRPFDEAVTEKQEQFGGAVAGAVRAAATFQNTPPVEWNGDLNRYINGH